jgi:DoxX-like family
MVKAGWVLTALFALFMVGASVLPKFLEAAPAVDSLVALGWPPRHLLLIGCLELAAVVLFVLPRTGLPGAVLMTGLLGGAIASHLRVGSPWFSHTLFGVYLGVLMWAALWLRDRRFRSCFGAGDGTP